MAKQFLKYLSVASLALVLSFVNLSLSLATDLREINVSAAASLTNAFQDIAKAFESKNADIKVNLNFASSNALLKQMQEGAKVEVFASADQETMDKADANKLIAPESRRDFVRNTLVLISPKGAKVKPSTVEDLPRLEKIAVGAPESVPAGRYAKESLESNGIWAKIQSKLIFAVNVRQVLDYVSRGEVDAGVVYATDAALRLDAVEVILTMTGHKPILYPIALGKQDKQAKLNIQDATTFIDFVCSDAGTAILSKYGFAKP